MPTSEKAGQKEPKLAVNQVKDNLAAALKRVPLPSALTVPQASSPSVTTFTAGCVVPQSNFVLGDIVCARVIGGTGRRLTFVDPSGFIRQITPIASDPQDISYQLPATDTSTVNGQTVDNRGTWRVNMITSRGSVVAKTEFVVTNPAAKSANLSISKTVRAGNTNITAGSSGAFEIFVTNFGPDAAANVVLSDALPANTTFVSFSQTDGPTFACSNPTVGGTGTVSCTLASFARGGSASFSLAYTVDAGTSAGTDICNTATIASDTSDPDTSDNSSQACITVARSGSGGGCTISCPGNVTTDANTTEGGQRGAHVTYGEPVGTGTCGAISSTPASGSFFPVGTTVVNATSETGGGSCSFTVTVEESNGNVTISCPSNKVADANGDCEATVTLGTPTTTGSNVTISVSRSDGKPMYDCDVNGVCTRKNPDLPFPAGVTTVTWVATSHDIPITNTTPPSDEEAHRTGNASCQQTVTVNDTTPPVITAVDSTVSADANCQAAVPDYSNSVTDNCACAANDNSQDCVGQHRITATQNPAAGTMVGLGPHTIHLTANDGSSNNGGAGNTTTKDITFTVNDTTAPVITCPANVTTNTEPGMCAAHVNPGTATATDNCDPNPTITASRSDNQALIATYPKGTTTITWTATDASGNHSSCQQTITVVDNEPPTITCPANITVYVAPNSTATSKVVTYTTPVGSDNCGGATTTQTAGLPSGASFPVGTTTNTFRVTDASGNYTECTFTVTVLYNFTGFFPPVGNPPILNAVNAGRAIPVKFSLSGNKGLNIFAPDNPYSVSFNCATNDPGVDVLETVTAGGSSLSFGGDQYVYVWKTESSWAGTCRQLVVTLNDGSVHVANFKFK